MKFEEYFRDNFFFALFFVQKSIHGVFGLIFLTSFFAICFLPSETTLTILLPALIVAIWIHMVNTCVIVLVFAKYETNWDYVTGIVAIVTDSSVLWLTWDFDNGIWNFIRSIRQVCV